MVQILIFHINIMHQLNTYSSPTMLDIQITKLVVEVYLLGYCSG